MIKNEFDKQQVEKLINEFNKEIESLENAIKERQGFIQKYREDLARYERFK